MLVQTAQREYRTWIFDSRRWRHYRPRPDDIVIATYPKCGTTWTQRIVGLLVFQTPEPKPMQISTWIDRQFPQPIEAVVATIEAQEHRRFLKLHVPLDGLPCGADILASAVAASFKDGARTLIYKGVNERWRGAASKADLALYATKAAAAFSCECADWVAHGRLRSGNPL
jgi:Sulfotransferase domain